MKRSDRRGLEFPLFNYRRRLAPLNKVRVRRIVLPDWKFRIKVTWCYTRRKVIYIKRIEPPT